MKRYDYRCTPCRITFESPHQRDATCPRCGRLAMRLYTSKPLRGWRGSSKEAT